MSKVEAETRRIEAAVRFAQVIHRNGGWTDVDRGEVFREAQAQGITIFDALRTHILLRVANGSAEVVSQWLRPIEFGDFSDNYAAFTVSQYQIANGEVERGLKQLRLLRKHIVERPHDLKSFTHLLPKVNETIGRATLQR